jgi:uncharacterized protein (TIGR00251 family)
VIREVEGGVELTLHLQPRASRTELVGAHGNALKLRIAAPPVDGEANDELIRFLAKTLGVTKAQVTIVSGATGRKKRVRVEGVAIGVVRTALDKALP